jgi:hypothetical protein
MVMAIARTGSAERSGRKLAMSVMYAEYGARNEVTSLLSVDKRVVSTLKLSRTSGE